MTKVRRVVDGGEGAKGDGAPIQSYYSYAPALRKL